MNKGDAEILQVIKEEMPDFVAVEQPAVLPFRSKKDGRVFHGRLFGSVPNGDDDRMWVVRFSDQIALWWYDEIQAEPCWKCGGTGLFCTHVLNGIPQSATGFDCWKCAGTGWIEKG